MKFRRTLLINLFLLLYVTIIYAQTEVKIPLPKNLKQGYPLLYITQDEKSNLELTIQNEDWAKDVLKGIRKRIDRYVERHVDDPEWMVSHLQMHWKTNALIVYVKMEILDSRNGIANSLLAKINGTGHHVIIKTSNPDYIPEGMAIKLSAKEGYGNFSRSDKTYATNIKLENQTKAQVLLLPGTENVDVNSKGKVVSVEIN